MNTNRKSDEFVAPVTSANNVAPEASAESIEERDKTKQIAPQAAAEKVDPKHDPAALAREARLMRCMSLACRWTFLVVALLWLLAIVFAPAASPPPPPRPALEHFLGPPGCVPCLQDNALYGRAIAYDEVGHPIFRRIEPQRSLHEPREVIAHCNGPTRR